MCYFHVTFLSWKPEIRICWGSWNPSWKRPTVHSARRIWFLRYCEINMKLACKTIARKLDSSSVFSWKNLSSKFLVLAWIMESRMCLLNLQTELGTGSRALKSWMRIKTNSGDWPNGLNKIQCDSGRRNVKVTFRWEESNAWKWN